MASSARAKRRPRTTDAAPAANGASSSDAAAAPRKGTAGAAKGAGAAKAGGAAKAAGSTTLAPITDKVAQCARRRVVLEAPYPEIDGGRFPARRVLGDVLRAEVDAFADGHDHVAGVVRWRHDKERAWHEAPLRELGNDRWAGDVPLTRMGRYRVTFEAWVDHWDTWRSDLRKRVDAEQDVTVDLQIGANHVRAAIERLGEGSDAAASETAVAFLTEQAELLEAGGEEGVASGLSDELDAHMRAAPDRSLSTVLGRDVFVEVERERAVYGAWYERFPRSTAPNPGEHGTLRTLVDELPRIAALGFDVLYVPPIHPIGRAHRKGPNNSTVAGPEDPGSPWAIGAAEGGHTAVHPDLGTLDDFDALLAACTEHGLELAMDLAYQCAPDHPWVTEHPTWFKQRPDGTIQYAENPPKKYQDIYPIDFETPDWEELWQGLKSVIDFWVARGVRIFRVDNPHTKAFPFWEWVIAAVRKETPDVVFLSEAFTRPKVMYRLAKLGFSQSYTYFAWRYSKHEFEEYLRELTTPPAVDVFRPNFWPNTPDILTAQLQEGTRGTYVCRLVLAATLAASYGIYGPAFELMESAPAKPGGEEYLDSEKYEVRWRDLGARNSLVETIRLVNAARREHPALHRNDTLRFHSVDNDSLIAYSKTSPEVDGRVGDDAILVIANLDDTWRQGGFVHLDLDALGLEPDAEFEVVDLLGGATYQWQGASNYVELDPAVLPAHVLHVRRRAHRDEHDFDGYS